MNGEKIPKTLIEAAHIKRGVIERLALAYYKSTVEELIREKLEKARKSIIRIEDLDFSERPVYIAHAAEDGGSSTIDMEAFTIYAVQAWSGSWIPIGNSYKVLREERIADIGIVYPSGRDEERVRIYRETLEAWITQKTIEELSKGYLLWDGSISTLLAGRRPWTETEWRARKAQQKAEQKLGMNLEQILDWISTLQAKHPLAILEELADLSLDADDTMWVAFIEWLGKLVAVRRLLDLSFKNKIVPVFVTKTTRSKSLVGGTFPDIYYLRRAEPYKLFLTRPIVRRGAVEAGDGVSKEFFPQPLGDYFQQGLTVVSFYLRLREGAQILRIEAVYPVDRLPPVDADTGKEEALRIVEWFLSLPTAKGYPIVLNIAHRQSHLSRRDLLHAVTILGFSLDRTGRSMLGE